MYMTGEDIRREIREHTGIILVSGYMTSRILIDFSLGHDYCCELHGPFSDGESHHHGDLRIFVVHRYTKGAHRYEFLVQDVYDDAFLNNGAAGAEKYNRRIGVVPAPRPSTSLNGSVSDRMMDDRAAREGFNPNWP